MAFLLAHTWKMILKQSTSKLFYQLLQFTDHTLYNSDLMSQLPSIFPRCSSIPIEYYFFCDQNAWFCFLQTLPNVSVDG